MINRLVIVSNRLPVTARYEHGRIHIEKSHGGLATGLAGPHERSQGLWIGWPGDLPRLDSEQAALLDAQLRDLRAVPVHLNRREVRGFYEGIANSVLWPLFHYLLDQIPPDVRGWEVFHAVNEKFARAVAANYRTGDLIWVHDYQLALVPGMLRRMIPNARIGYFLHIPFPSSEVFSVLPWRNEILRGMLGADLIGFHTPSYLRHFATTLQRMLGKEADVDRVWDGDREVRLGIFPMSIDAAAWAARAEAAPVLREADQIRNEAAGKKIIVGIDRMDYTKGLLRRFLALQRLFDREPHLRERVRVIQVAVPSRERVEGYAGLRRRLDELISRINSTYGTPTSMPIHYMHKSLSEDEVAALYRAADVMLVTPLRDGMNLVAKEFVASRTDEAGVLVLSEFAGAATELGDALQVNPYDVERMALVYKRALEMTEPEQADRMRALRERVTTHDVHRWASAFIDALRESAVTPARAATASSQELVRFVKRAREAHGFLLILDYDGTLVPFAPTPEEAAPDAAVLDLLQAVAARQGTRVHVVSGRKRESLQTWLGDLPIGLHAEHGLWSRLDRDARWTRAQLVPSEWKQRVRPLMEHFVATTRGSFIEDKTASLAWHYRLASAGRSNGADFGEHQAREMRLLLGELLSNAPVEVISGNKVVEVRPHGVHKGIIVPAIIGDHLCPETILAIGDDRTDEDLFAALPDGSVTVKVGEGTTRALYRLSGVQEVRDLLLLLAQEPAGVR